MALQTKLTSNSQRWPASSSRELGLKMCATTSWLVLNFLMNTHTHMPDSDQVVHSLANFSLTWIIFWYSNVTEKKMSNSLMGFPKRMVLTSFLLLSWFETIPDEPQIHCVARATMNFWTSGLLFKCWGYRAHPFALFLVWRAGDCSQCMLGKHSPTELVSHPRLNLLMCIFP